MQKDSFDVHREKNSIDKSRRISVKRSNARVSNIRLKTRTKSENGILCGYGNYSTLSEDNHISQLERRILLGDNDAMNQVKLRPIKRRMYCAENEEQNVVVTAIYSYQPSQDDELTLFPGDKVRVLSSDCRDSGTEGWWVGMRDSQIGVFPMSYVHTDASWSLIKGVSGHEGPSDILCPSNENTKITLAQYVDIASEKNGRNSNGFALSGSTGVRMISSTEIVKMECLGSGAFGVVYHGRWQNKEVAVKTFSVHANEVHIYQEAGHLSCLLHPNIVRLFGVSIINDIGSQIALIMEYARGGALHQFLHFGPKVKLSPNTLLQMSKQIAIGMRYLHNEAAICHRDLKSSNVLIKESIPDFATDAQIANCTLLITDFGMARRTAELLSQQSKLGTLAYAAPEVCRQQGGFSVKSDVWSYGVLLWELLTVEIPFRDVEHPHLLYKIAIKNQTLHIPSGIPSLLVNLLTSCWNEERELRPDFENICQNLKCAQKCKFMEICAEEFYEIQGCWREEIRLSEKQNEESMTSSETERDEFLEQQREIEYAREDIQRREEDMLRREAACSQAMGTVNQLKLLFSVLVANRIPHISNIGDHNVASHFPPVPPTRKRPFVGRLKFWSHKNYRSTETFASFQDEGGGNPKISSPINLQHVVHISKQDLNLASPALRFFPDTMKMNTWGPKSQGKSTFNCRNHLKSTDETDQDMSTPSNPFVFEDLCLQMDYNDSICSPSPCIDTLGSIDGVTDQVESNLCSSAPNLRKISLGNLPAFEFSSFRRPISEKAEEDSDHRKKIPCQRCRNKYIDRSSTTGQDIATSAAESGRETWSCIPISPPVATSRQQESESDKKHNLTDDIQTKRSKKTKNRFNSKLSGCNLPQAMWSIMRMLSAVVLPDRSAHEIIPVTYASVTKASSTQENEDSREEKVRISILDSEYAYSDSVFHAPLYYKSPQCTQSRPFVDKDAFNMSNLSSPSRPSRLKSFSRSRTRINHRNDLICKCNVLSNATEGASRGSSVPASRRLKLSTGAGNEVTQSQSPNQNYFSSWLPLANSQIDLKTVYQSTRN